jgi:hypothetical protein
MTPETPLSANPSEASVSAGLGAFMEGLIDYAGLFPPARLPLDQAVSSYAAYRHSGDAWMLGRFICPANRLADLRPYTDLFQPDAPFPVAVLGTGGPEPDDFHRALRDNLAATRSFLAEHPGGVTAEVLEVRLPDDIAEATPASIGAFFDRIAEAVAAADIPLERIYLEVGFSGEWRRTLDGVLRVLARPPEGLRFGLKIRCGGETADAFRTPEQIAHVLARCRDVKLPVKATAGLHHPIRHFNRDLQVMSQGFFNVFGAAVLAHALDLTEPALRQVLRNEQIKTFSFDDTGFGFQDLRVTTQQIAIARKAFAHSFGSCSFDEPREDLRAAGLL